MNEAKKNPQKLKELWEDSAAKSPVGPPQTFEYNAYDDPSNPEIEEQIENLIEAFTNARLDFQALFSYQGTEFFEKWDTITSDEEKKKFLEDAREGTSNKGSIHSIGIMYCPELNSDDLLKNENLKDLFNTCNKFTEDISQLDSFTNQLSLQMKAKGMFNKKVFLTMIYCRRWVLLTFCVHVIIYVLNLGTPIDEKPQEGEERNENEYVPANNIVKIAQQSLSTLITSGGGDVSVKEQRVSEIKEEPLRKCNNSSCVKRETFENRFTVCGKCRKVNLAVPYCSRKCQEEDCKSGHKAICGVAIV